MTGCACFLPAGSLLGHMACILLTNMDRPGSAHLGGPPPTDQEPTPAKREEDAACLVVHLYNRAKGSGCGAKGSEDTLAFPPGEFAAEELCISAARACGESRGGFTCDFSNTNTHSDLMTHLWRGCSVLQHRMSQMPTHFAVCWKCGGRRKCLTKYVTQRFQEVFFSSK